jgi:outer membrane protein assembly factor BamB
MRCSPIVSGKLLHIGTDNGTFTALDVDTGKRVWTYMPDKPTLCNDGGWMRPCEVYSSALLADGLRFQGSEDNHTRCFNATTGECLWEKPAAGNVDGTPVVGVPGSNSIWVGADDGFLYNLNMTTGENVLPPVQHCGTMESQPATDPTKGVLFSMCRKPGWTPASKSSEGTVFALDMHKGTFLWSIQCTGGVPIYAAERNAIFVAAENGTAFAADATTGQLIWTQQGLPLRARFMGPFAYDHGRGLLYGANFAGLVCALNATSGEVVWTYRVQSTKHMPYIPVPLGPRISSDASLLYFGAYDYVFHALKLTD